MKLSKLLLAVAGITLLLGTLTSTASARILSLSSQRARASWTRFDIAGGFGTIECEVVLEASFTSRTVPKAVASAVGYITAGNVPRCTRGGATLLRETLPWSLTYASFTGTLPNIATTTTNITGLSFSIREPFGLTGLARIGLRDIIRRVIRWGLNAARTALEAIQVIISGSCIINFGNCTVNGTTTNVDNGSGSAITITLI